MEYSALLKSFAERYSSFGLRSPVPLSNEPVLHSADMCSLEMFSNLDILLCHCAVLGQFSMEYEHFLREYSSIEDKDSPEAKELAKYGLAASIWSFLSLASMMVANGFQIDDAMADIEKGDMSGLPLDIRFVSHRAASLVSAIRCGDIQSFISSSFFLLTFHYARYVYASSLIKESDMTLKQWIAEVNEKGNFDSIRCSF